MVFYKKEPIVKEVRVEFDQEEFLALELRLKEMTKTLIAAADAADKASAKLAEWSRKANEASERAERASTSRPGRRW